MSFMRLKWLSTRPAVNAGDIVFCCCSPMDIPGILVNPLFDAGKQALGARTISLHRVRVLILAEGNHIRLGGVRLEIGHQILGTRHDKDVLIGVFGSPFSVFRVMRGMESCHPRPKGPLPLPVLYGRVSWGPNPARPGEVKIGTEKLPVPVKRLRLSVIRGEKIVLS